MEPAHLVDARGKVSRGDQEEQAERPPGWRAPGDDARRPLGSQRARGRKGICAEWPGQRPQVLNGASLNGAPGEERGLQPFSLLSDESIPELAGCQASAQLPAGLTPTSAQLSSSYLRGAGILFSTERHWKPSYPFPPESGILDPQGEGGSPGVGEMPPASVCTWADPNKTSWRVYPWVVCPFPPLLPSAGTAVRVTSSS